LVLLPGLDGTGILFGPLLGALPDWINPIVVSYPPDRHLTYDQLLPVVMNALPPSESFILLGESFSGPLAIMAAATHPSNLLGVILCATFVTSPIPLISPILRLFAQPFFIFRTFPAAQRTKALLGRYSNPRLQELFAEVHTKVPPHVIAARVRMVLRVDVRSQLQSCDTPMLYIAATSDRVVPRRNLRLIRHLRPNLQTVTIKAPHGIPQARPVEAAEAISNFAKSVGDKVR
jgi:pimeloyl-[acyl-carrier protein] methyl ester esterase